MSIMQEIKEGLDLIKNNPSSLIILIPIGLSIIYLLPKLKNLMDFFEERQSKKLAKLMSAQESELMSDTFKEHLKETIQKKHFYDVTGIANLPISACDKILEVAKTLQLDVNHFKQAKEFLRFDNNGLQVKLSRLDKFRHRALQVLGVISAIILGILWMMILHPAFETHKINQLPTTEKIGLMFLPVVSYFFCLYLMLDTRNAKLIQKKLATLPQ